MVSGVSIMLVKREEFSGFVAQKGVDALLAEIEKGAA
jgi:ABC-type transporter MlaC component